MGPEEPHAPSGTLRLRAGLRVSRRGDGLLQVGLHPDDRVVLGDSPEVRRLLRDLRHGVRTALVPLPLGPVLDALRARDLLETPERSARRRQLLAGARVAVTAPEPVRTEALRMLSAACLGVAGARDPGTVVLHVTSGSEPRRPEVDRWMREDRPHLLVTATTDRTRLGPFVVPGVTACLRCVDEHLTDRDPRHPLVLEQHHDADDRHRPRPEDLQLVLAHAVRDLARWAGGGRPTTWSATLELDGVEPTSYAWARHPRCGCAWGDALAG